MPKYDDPNDLQKQNALVRLASKYIDPISDNVIMPTMDAVSGAANSIGNAVKPVYDEVAETAKYIPQLPGAYYDAMKHTPSIIADMMTPDKAPPAPAPTSPAPAPQDDSEQQAKMIALNRLKNK